MNWRFDPVQKIRSNEAAIYLASSLSDLHEVDRLWREVYGRELGWLHADKGTLYGDRYHPHSVYLLATVGGSVVGTMRLVRDAQQGLPVEQFVPIDKIRAEPGRRLVECQRLMILEAYRNQRLSRMPFGILAALVKGCLHWCIQNDVSHVVADLFTGTQTTPLSPLLALGFTETGLEFIDTQLNEPDRSIALLLHIGELFSRSFRSDSAFYRYLMAPDDAIDVYT
ncbi:GNAT family N-acyltransferase [Micromonospora sp. Llam0]|uniref:N-acyl amino acid synthase FeeM domain-containing protein n=1 Tax=Micromonospora sp. Llam0 TaxID=2485143 RepID=UPI001F1DEF5A|nr:GNAT family N-acyltransferase [Micromonospora sp. Llam0]